MIFLVAVNIWVSELAEGGGISRTTEGVGRSCRGEGNCEGKGCELHRGGISSVVSGSCKIMWCCDCGNLVVCALP